MEYKKNSRLIVADRFEFYGLLGNTAGKLLSNFKSDLNISIQLFMASNSW